MKSWKNCQSKKKERKKGDNIFQNKVLNEQEKKHFKMSLVLKKEKEKTFIERLDKVDHMSSIFGLG